LDDANNYLKIARCQLIDWPISNIVILQKYQFVLIVRLICNGTLQKVVLRKRKHFIK